MIEIEDISCHYGDTRAVDGVSLTIATGTVTAVVGSSGSGKTTLLRMINRLVEPTAGRVRIDGVETATLPLAPLRRGIGYVIQDHGLFPHWTVVRNIATVPRLLGWPKAEIAGRVAELLRLLGLDPDEIGPRYPHELSGGQAQRVGVARALAARPRVLLMDEPFGALDPIVRAQAQADLRSLQRHQGATIVLVTHDMDEALRLADRVAVMRAGRLDQEGTPSEILARPATAFVADLVGERDRAFRYLALRAVADLVEPGTAPGPAIAAGATLAEALAQMIWSGQDALPVTGAAGAPLGLIRRARVMAAGRPG